MESYGRFRRLDQYPKFAHMCNNIFSTFVLFFAQAHSLARAQQKMDRASLKRP